MTNADYAIALVDLAGELFDGLDGAFNNAEMMCDMSQITDMTESTWKEIITTNLTSAFFYRQSTDTGDEIKRRIVSITSSFVGFSNGGMPGMGAYAASKAGLIALVQSLAMDHVVEGIRENSLLAGGTKTAMAGDDAETHEFIANLHPMKRMATPEEIAKAALFLLPDSSEFVTGSAMAVDGGKAIVGRLFRT